MVYAATDRKHITFYFAYGQDMCEREMRKQEKCPGAVCWGTGYLVHRKLEFVGSAVGAEAAATIRESYNDILFGVLYDIPSREEWESLDNSAGERKKEILRVRMLPGKTITEAYAFIPENNDKGEKRTPYEKYIGLMIEGAKEHGLPVDYIKFLESLR